MESTVDSGSMQYSRYKCGEDVCYSLGEAVLLLLNSIQISCIIISLCLAGAQFFGSLKTVKRLYSYHSYNKARLLSKRVPDGRLMSQYILLSVILLILLIHLHPTEG